MADYPDVVQAFGTQVTGSDGTQVERAASGKPRFRTYYTQVRDSITVVHDLDDADKALIDAHYSTDRLNAFNFTFKADNTVYTVRYASTPQWRPIPGGRWAGQVNLIVV